jgi:serine phosphatase RsbU (regulator of sigma subunit)
MRPEPSLTVAGPRAPAGGTVDVGLDGLLAALPVLSLRWDAGGTCVQAAGTEPDSAGITGALAGDGWLDLIHPDDRERAVGLVASALGGEVVRDDGLRLGSEDRWAVLRVGPASDGGAEGALVEATHAIGDAARMARIVSRLNRLSDPNDIVDAVLGEVTTLLGAKSASIFVLSDGGGSLELAGLRGYPPGNEKAGLSSFPLDAPVPVAEVLQTGEMVVIGSAADREARYPLLARPEVEMSECYVVVPLVDADAHPFGALAIGFPEGRELCEAEQQSLADLTAQSALALDRARLTAIADHRQAHLRFLDELNESVSQSLELEGRLRRLAEIMVPQVADWCAVRLATGPAEPHPVVGAAHVVPELVDELVRLGQQLPHLLDESGDLGKAITKGRVLLERGEALDAFLALLGEDARPALAAVGVETVVLFPLNIRGRLIGGIAFGYGEDRSFSYVEAELAEVVADRAATLIDNVRLFEERSNVARALQDSLLPGSLPHIPGLQLGARYRAAGHGMEVGGDFYDAFHADDNWWVVAVGDVCGHGVEAAALTGLVRHTIRASAMAGAMPSAILNRLNQMLLRHSAELSDAGGGEGPYTPRFCTVVLGAVKPTPEGVDIVLCLGGHPHPLVRRADGRVAPVGVAGTLLGVTEPVSLNDSVVHLDPGEALVCFTDGLTDRRVGTSVFGEDGIAGAVREAGGLSAGEMAIHIERAAVDYTPQEPTDDMAVLTLLANPE